MTGTTAAVTVTAHVAGIEIKVVRMTPAGEMVPAIGGTNKTVKTETAVMTVMDAATAEKAIAAIGEVITTEAIATIGEVITTEAIAIIREVITTEMTVAIEGITVTETTTATKEATVTEMTARVAKAVTTLTHGERNEINRDRATVTVILETGAIITPAKVVPRAITWLPWTSSPC